MKRTFLVSVFRFASIRVIRGLIFCLFLSAAFAVRGQGLPPRITSQPTNQIVVAGSEVRFAVGTAASATPLRFQWKKGAIAIPNATNAVLVLTNIKVLAAGEYFVSVLNTAGSVNGQIATLGVAGVRSQSVSLGANAAFVVNVSGFTATGLQWQYNGVDIPGATQVGYVVANAREADAGNYSVIVTHSTGSITAPATLDVDPTFTKITSGPIVDEPVQLSIGTAWADYNNDGYLDLIIVGGSNGTNQKNLLYQNNRDGTFTKIIAGPLAQEPGIAAGTAWADFDNDGFLDVVVANATGTVPQTSALYRNLDGNSFLNVTPSALGSSVKSASTAVWGDYDNDGRLDLYLPGFYGPNITPYLYRNVGDGTFARITKVPPVSFSDNTQGAGWADYDGDGYLDLFVFKPDGKNLLFHNDANGSFTKILTGPAVNDAAASRGAAWGTAIELSAITFKTRLF